MLLINVWDGLVLIVQRATASPYRNEPTSILLVAQSSNIVLTLSGLFRFGLFRLLIFLNANFGGKWSAKILEVKTLFYTRHLEGSLFIIQKIIAKKRFENDCLRI